MSPSTGSTSAGTMRSTAPAARRTSGAVGRISTLLTSDGNPRRSAVERETGPHSTVCVWGVFSSQTVLGTSLDIHERFGDVRKCPAEHVCGFAGSSGEKKGHGVTVEKRTTSPGPWPPYFLFCGGASRPKCQESWRRGRNRFALTAVLPPRCWARVAPSQQSSPHSLPLSHSRLPPRIVTHHISPRARGHISRFSYPPVPRAPRAACRVHTV